MDTFTASSARRFVLLLVALLLAFGSGAAAKGKYDARLAKNSDKVDGKHAVRASATPAKRKGKLVATDPKTGRLPNDIIGSAPDAARLGGVSATTFKRLTFPATSAGESSGASDGSQINNEDANLDQANDGSLSWQFLLPGDRVQGDPIYADVLYQDGSAAACSWFATTGAPMVTEDGTFANYAWIIPGSTGYQGPINVPAGAAMAQQPTFRLAVNDRKAGDLVTFTLGRKPGDPSDNCGFGIRIKAVQFRY